MKVTILPGRNSYNGSERNGVTSSSYGAWGGNFMVERADSGPAAEGSTESGHRHVDKINLGGPGSLR